jgi:hypothetical protein
MITGIDGFLSYWRVFECRQHVAQRSEEMMNAMTRKVLSTAAAATAAAGVITVAAPGSPAFAQAAPCVQNIAVINNGAYTASFVVSNRAGITSTPTDSFNINTFRLVDLTGTPIPAGDDVRPIISAQAGNTEPADEFVSYCANGQTATYTATGTTLNVDVTLQR